MTDYFAEKSNQVSPSRMDGFGITLISRHGRAKELIELLVFATLAAEKKVSRYVKEAFTTRSQAGVHWKSTQSFKTGTRWRR